MNWYDHTQGGCYKGGAAEINKYNEAVSSRRLSNPVDKSVYFYASIVEELEENGYAVIRNAIDVEKVKALAETTSRMMLDPSALKLNNASFQMIEQPLYNVDGAFELAFDDMLVGIASEYFNCLPAIGTVNMKKTKLNNHQPADALLYHSDSNSIKFLKFFFYLNDVDIDGGPFTYIQGSHKKKFFGWQEKYRWSDNEIEGAYGKESVKHLTANVGDLIICNVTGFHKGLKPRNKERTMYTVNYTIHPEYWKPITFKIRKEDYERLSEEKKPVADFLLTRKRGG